MHGPKTEMAWTTVHPGRDGGGEEGLTPPGSHLPLSLGERQPFCNS